MHQDAGFQPGTLQGQDGIKLQHELGTIPAVNSKEKQTFLAVSTFSLSAWRPKPSFP